MRNSRLSVALLAASAVALVAGTADAHAHLVRANPAANSAMKGSPRMIHVTFSEPLIASFSGLNLTTTRGKSVGIGRTMQDPRDRSTLIADVPQPLAPGTYLVRWRAVSADTHRMTGQYSFRVR